MPTDIILLFIQYFGKISSEFLLISVMKLIDELQHSKYNPLNIEIIQDRLHDLIYQNKEFATSLTQELAKYCHTKLMDYNVNISLQCDLEKEYGTAMHLYQVLGRMGTMSRTEKLCVMNPWRKYRELLAHRMIYSNHWNDALEREIIKRASRSGYNFEQMFKDKEWSEQFKNELNVNDVILNKLLICNKQVWPRLNVNRYDKHVVVNDDGHIKNLLDEIERQYFDRKPGQSCQYLFNYGQARLTVKFNEKIKKVLCVSWYQMCILLCFNYGKILTFGQIYRSTRIYRKNLVNAILSMAHPKIKILRKSPNNKECKDKDKFQINAKYYHNRAKIVVKTMEFQNVGELDEKEDEKVDAVDIETTKSLKRVRVLDIDVVMQWDSLNNEWCAICGYDMYRSCINCIGWNRHKDVACKTAWGKCKHQFHLHCIDRWLEVRDTCPRCNVDWQFLSLSD